MISSLDLLVLLLATLPFEASFTQMALAGFGWSSDALLGDATYGYRMLSLTQCLTASWLPSVRPNLLYNCLWFRDLQSLSLVVAQVGNVVLALALDVESNHVIVVLFYFCWCCIPSLFLYVMYFYDLQGSSL